MRKTSKDLNRREWITRTGLIAGIGGLAGCKTSVETTKSQSVAQSQTNATAAAPNYNFQLFLHGMMVVRLPNQSNGLTRLVANIPEVQPDQYKHGYRAGRPSDGNNLLSLGPYEYELILASKAQTVPSSLVTSKNLLLLGQFGNCRVDPTTEGKTSTKTYCTIKLPVPDDYCGVKLLWSDGASGNIFDSGSQSAKNCAPGVTQLHMIHVLRYSASNTPTLMDATHKTKIWDPGAGEAKLHIYAEPAVDPQGMAHHLTYLNTYFNPALDLSRAADYHAVTKDDLPPDGGVVASDLYPLWQVVGGSSFDGDVNDCLGAFSY